MASVFSFVFAVVLLGALSSCRNTVPTSAGSIPLPAPAKPPNARSGEQKLCEVNLRSDMKYGEMAVAAYLMQKECGLSPEEVRQRVRKVFSAAGAGVVAQTKSPVLFEQVKTDKR